MQYFSETPFHFRYPKNLKLTFRKLPNKIFSFTKKKNSDMMGVETLKKEYNHQKPNTYT